MTTPRALDVSTLLGRKLVREIAYDDRDILLYALSLGYGSDPLNRDELPFVYEAGLRVVPTIPTVMGGAVGLLSHEKDDLDFQKLVNGEQRLDLAAPLPKGGVVVTEVEVTGLVDKGPGKGLLMLLATAVRMKDTGVLIASGGSTKFFRADGGRGGGGVEAPTPHLVPDRAPDHVLAIPTRRDLPLLFRLTGDRARLHVDPDFAQGAGFERPIMHGLCTYGIACRAVLQSICGYDPTMIRAFDVRFSAPAYPGETMVTEMWRDGEVVSFRTIAQERGVTVLSNGRCLLV